MNALGNCSHCGERKPCECRPTPPHEEPPVDPQLIEADTALATLSPASHDPYEGHAAREGMMDDPASHDSRLADELERLAGMAPSGPWKNGLWAGSEPQKHVVDMGEPPKAPFLLAQERSAYTTPYGVVHSDGPPGEVEAATALIIALHRNLPTILAALRSTPAPDALETAWRSGFCRGAARAGSMPPTGVEVQIAWLAHLERERERQAALRNEGKPS